MRGRALFLAVLWLLALVALLAALALVAFGGPLAPEIDVPGATCYCVWHI